MPRAKTPTTTVKKRAPRKPAAKLAKAGKASPKSVTRFVDPEQRAALIAEAAYFRAEKRGFASGHETADWLAAERDVDSKLLRGAGANSRS
jgi:hypothetical protein